MTTTLYLERIRSPEIERFRIASRGSSLQTAKDRKLIAPFIHLSLPKLVWHSFGHQFCSSAPHTSPQKSCSAPKCFDPLLQPSDSTSLCPEDRDPGVSVSQFAAFLSPRRHSTVSRSWVNVSAGPLAPRARANWRSAASRALFRGTLGHCGAAVPTSQRVEETHPTVSKYTKPVARRQRPQSSRCRRR